MGLQTVELVMDLEDAFAVSIPDDEASLLESVGQTHDCIVRLLRDQRATSRYVGPNGTIDEEAVWQTIRRMVSKQFGVSQDAIRRHTRYTEDLGAG